MKRTAYLQVGKPGKPKKFKTFSAKRKYEVCKKCGCMFFGAGMRAEEEVRERARIAQLKREIGEILGAVDLVGPCNSFLRDVFAGFAVSGIALSYWEKDRLERILKRVASTAFRVADIMMVERKKRARR